MRTQIAYEGYFENGEFIVSGKAVQLPNNRRIVVTVMDDIIIPVDDEGMRLKVRAELDELNRLL